MKTISKQANIILLSAMSIALLCSASSYAETKHALLHNLSAQTQGALIKVHDREHKHSHANSQQREQHHTSSHKHQPMHRPKHRPKHRPRHSGRHYHHGYGYHHHDDYHYHNGHHNHGHSHYYHSPHGGYIHFRLRPFSPAIRARGNIVLDF